MAGCAQWFVGDDPAARRALAGRWTDDAIIELRAGEIDAGRARLIDAVELAPDHAEARTVLGILLLAEGRIEDATVQFQWAVSAQPDVALYHFHLALAWLAADNAGFATPALNRAIELDPGLLAARRALFEAYLRLGRWDRAARLLEELRRSPEANDALLAFQSALLDFAEERLDQARVGLRTAVRDLKDDPAPLVALGLLYAQQGLLAEAEQAYKAGLARDGRDPWMHLVLADFYHAQGRYRLADIHLQRTLTRRSALPADEVGRSYAQLADVAYQRGAYRNSRLYQRRAVSLLPSLAETTIGIDAAAHYALGIVELQRDNVDPALREFSLAIKADDRFTLAWARYAETLLAKAELSAADARQPLIERAIKAAERAQELAPRSALGYYIQGRALRVLADLQEGVFRSGTLRESNFAFQKARNAERAPDDISLYQSGILSDLASYPEAASTLTDAQRVLPERYELPFLRAAELIKAERFIDARAALSEAWLLQPGAPEIPPAMSVVLFRLGDVDGAAKALAWAPGSAEPLPGLVEVRDPRPQQAGPVTDETVSADELVGDDGSDLEATPLP